MAVQDHTVRFLHHHVYSRRAAQESVALDYTPHVQNERDPAQNAAAPRRLTQNISYASQFDK